MKSFFKSRENLIASFVLFLVTFLIYSPAVFFQFIYYDDNGYVFENIHLQKGLSPIFLNWAFTTFHFANWHPLTWLSYAFDWELYGLWPGGYHLTNIVLHAINALFIFILFLRMTGSVGKSFLVAAFFAWHPVRVESVAWIAERKDMLSTFFVLISIWLYLNATGSAMRQNTTIRARRWPFMAFALIFFSFSLMSKPMYVSLPILLLLFDFWPLRREQILKNLVIEKIPFIILSAVACYLALLSQSAGGAIHHFADAPLLIRFANISKTYWDYILLFIWPEKLSIFYPYLPNTHIIRSFMIGVIFILLTMILFFRRKTLPALWVGWCFFGITLLPVAGIVTIGTHWIACRYLYWPAIGLSIMLIWGIEILFNKIKFSKNAARIIVMGVLAAYLVATSVYLSYWQNSYKLFQHAVDVIPNNWVAHISLRAAYGRDGNHEKAAEHLIEAIKILPDITNRTPLNWFDFYYMGVVNWHKGKIPQTESFLREAARQLDTEPIKNLSKVTQLERSNLATCLAAFDAKNPSSCIL